MTDEEIADYDAAHPDEVTQEDQTLFADDTSTDSSSDTVEDYTNRTTVTNADGSRTQKFDDGSSQTIDASGRVSYTPAPSENLSPEVVQQGNALLNSLTGAAKKAFTKSDGSLDWSALLALAGGAYGFATADKQDLSGVGFTGSIPDRVAAREQVPYQYDSERRPGSGGRRYFSDVFYGASSDADTLKQQAKTQAQGLAGLQTPFGDIRGSLATPTGYNQQEISAALARELALRPDTSQQAMTDYATQRYGITADQVAKAYEDYGIKKLAAGGIATLAKGGRYLDGDTNGMADKISTQIDGKDPAALSHGEYVVSADVVAALGGGNNENGAQILDRMMDRVRKQAHGTKKQMRPVEPTKVLPA